MATSQALSRRTVVPWLLIGQIILTSILWVLWRLVLPPPLVEWLLLGGLMAVIGIPHGAADLQLLAGRFPRYPRWLTFGVYLLIFGAATALMLVWPAVGLVGLLLLSALHFGQGELSVYRGLTETPFGRRLAFGWGLNLLLALFTLRAAELPGYLPAELGLGGVADFFARLPIRLNGFAGGAAGLLALAVGHGYLTPRQALLRLAGTAVLLGLFASTSLLFGFTVYFGLWHSADSIRIFSRDLFGSDAPPEVRRFYAAALPTTVLAVLLLGGLGWVNAHLAAPLPWPLLLLTFIFGITVPHVVVTTPVYHAAR